MSRFFFQDALRSFMRKLDVTLDTLAENQAEALSLLRQIASNAGTAASDLLDDVLPQHTKTLEELYELDGTLESSDCRRKLVRHKVQSKLILLSLKRNKLLRIVKFVLN
jgi:predicted RecB family endonuclease